MDEQTKALVDKAKADAEAAAQKIIDGLKADMNNVVEELKDTRVKKQEVEAERDILKTKVTPPKQDGAPDVRTEVTQILSEYEKNRIADTQKNSIKKFKETHKEFHPDNDPGGVKYAAFEKKLSRINTNGLTSEEDFLGAFEDALVILNKGQTAPQTQQRNPYASTSQTPPTPKSDSDSGLTSQEEELYKSLGWDEAKYLKLKKSKPAYVASLLKFQGN